MNENLVCPQCGCGPDGIFTTDMAFTGRNENNVKCHCGYEGTAQDWIDIQELKDKLKTKE